MGQGCTTPQRIIDQETADTKYCTVCKEIKPLSEFYFQRRGRKFASGKCIICDLRRERERKYDMTVKDYEKMLKEQNGKCKICGTTVPGGNKSVFCIDHDPKIKNRQKSVRGLLCNNCNRTIGLFKDNPELLITAANYLLEAKAK